MEQREEAVKDFRLRDLLIKNMTSGILNKLILYRLSRNRLKKQLQKKQWIDWLRTKAGQSHPVGKHSLREKQGAASRGADAALRVLEFGRADTVSIPRSVRVSSSVWSGRAAAGQ